MTGSDGASPATAPFTAVAAVAMPASADAGFDDALGARVVWMTEHRLGHAELRVTPEGLGTIDIRLQVDGQRLSAQFTAANADVRHALEAGMDRLRDLLGRHGMELAQSSVGSGQQQAGQRRQEPARMGDRSPESAPDAPAVVTTVRLLRARGLIDEYV